MITAHFRLCAMHFCTCSSITELECNNHREGGVVFMEKKGCIKRAVSALPPGRCLLQTPLSSRAPALLARLICCAEPRCLSLLYLLGKEEKRAREIAFWAWLCVRSRHMLSAGCRKGTVRAAWSLRSQHKLSEKLSEVSRRLRAPPFWVLRIEKGRVYFAFWTYELSTLNDKSLVSEMDDLFSPRR